MTQSAARAGSTSPPFIASDKLPLDRGGGATPLCLPAFWPPVHAYEPRSSNYVRVQRNLNRHAQRTLPLLGVVKCFVTRAEGEGARSFPCYMRHDAGWRPAHKSAEMKHNLTPTGTHTIQEAQVRMDGHNRPTIEASSVCASSAAVTSIIAPPSNTPTAPAVAVVIVSPSTAASWITTACGVTASAARGVAAAAPRGIRAWPCTQV